MHLVQILLPIYDNEGNAIPKNAFHEVQRTLTETFGGVTAYSRAPAEGLWKESPGSTTRDDIVVYEVMFDALDRRWWSKFREELRTQFRQEELVVRALECEQL
jgi:hypothetical protein